MMVSSLFLRPRLETLLNMLIAETMLEPATVNLTVNSIESEQISISSLPSLEAGVKDVIDSI